MPKKRPKQFRNSFWRRYVPDFDRRYGQELFLSQIIHYLNMLELEGISSAIDIRKVINFIQGATESEVCISKRKIIKLLTPVLKKIKQLPEYSNSYRAALSEAMKAISSKLTNFRRVSYTKCYPLQQLVKQSEDCLGVRFNMIPWTGNQVEVQAAQSESSWTNDYLKQTYDSQNSMERKHPPTDVNKEVQKINSGELVLPDPRNPCCSPVLYRDWPATHSGLSQAPLLFVKEKTRIQLQNAVTALINSKTGGTILVGCQRQKGGSKITSAATRYRSKKNRLIFQDQIERIKGNLYPKDGKNNLRVSHSFIALKTNPLHDKDKASLCLIPRVVVKPIESVPTYLEIKKTLHKSEYYVYQHLKVNYNVWEVGEVKGLGIYPFICSKEKDRRSQMHWGSPCVQPAPDQLLSLLGNSEDSQSEEVAIHRTNQIHLGAFRNKVESLPKVSHQLVKKYAHCCLLTAPDYGYNGRDAKSHILDLLTDLEKARVDYELFAVFYQKEFKRVCYLMGMNHLFSDIAQRIKKKDKIRVLEMGELFKILRLPDNLGEEEKNKFNRWDEFFNIYKQYYPRKTLSCKYRLKEGIYENYVYVQTKQQAILAMIILDFLGYRPTFISDKKKIDETHEMNI